VLHRLVADGRAGTDGQCDELERAVNAVDPGRPVEEAHRAEDNIAGYRLGPVADRESGAEETVDSGRCGAFAYPHRNVPKVLVQWALLPMPDTDRQVAPATWACASAPTANAPARTMPARRAAGPARIHSRPRCVYPPVCLLSLKSARPSQRLPMISKNV